MPSVASRAFKPHSGFSDRVAELLDRIDCRPAASAAEREAIFRLRYRAYLSEGTIKPSFAQSFTDPYDETDNVWLLGLYLDGELASSIRLHVASADRPDFPSLKVFAEVLEPELAAGKIIIDPTRFVTDKRHSRANPGLPYATARLAWLAAEHFRAAHLLAAVRVEHQAFYRRTFNHHVIGEARPYPLLTQPISLMTVHYASVAGRVHRRYPFFRSTFFERRMLFDRGAAVAHMAFPPATVAHGMHHAA
jgi:N-acyl-L-homoserine lactone synthetase